jgi:hypothetical protein
VKNLEEFVTFDTTQNYEKAGTYTQRHCHSCGYEIPQVRAFVNGFLFERTGEGFVTCIDLRTTEAQ